MTVGKRFTCAALLWFASVLLMSLAPVVPERTHLAGWSILAAIAAIVPSGWLIVDHVVTKERQRSHDEIREIAEAVLVEADRLHSV
jgi:hypothetical protein